MTHDEIEQEARARLADSFERMGLEDPEEMFSKAELRALLEAERRHVIKSVTTWPEERC